MKKLLLAVAVLWLLTSACNNAATNEKSKQDTSTKAADKPAPPPMDSAAAAKAWNDYKTPGDMHKLLASWSGTWAVVSEQWMAPGAPPIQSKATLVTKMDLDGLYQVNEYTGEMFGMPFKGRGTTAYDNAKKMFVSTWIDNMGSGIIYMSGKWDAASKTLTQLGKQTDPTTLKDCDTREVLKVLDDKHQEMDMYIIGADGKETKVMHAVMTKQ